MRDYYVLVSVTAAKELPDGHLQGVGTSLILDRGKWLRNDEIDGGEYLEVPPPPPEVVAYLKSLVDSK